MTTFEKAAVHTFKVALHMVLVALLYVLGSFIASFGTVPTYVLPALTHFGIPAGVIGLAWTFAYQYFSEHPEPQPSNGLLYSICQDILEYLKGWEPVATPTKVVVTSSDAPTPATTSPTSTDAAPQVQNTPQ